MIAATAPALAGFEFDAERHEYRLDGKVIPSVTQACQMVGLVPAYRVTRELLSATGDLGDKVHLATHYADEGTLDRAHLHASAPILEPFVAAWEAFKRDEQFVPLLSEHRGVGWVVTEGGRRLPFGFTLDRLGYWRGRRLLIADLKSGKTIHRATGVQCAGYVTGVLSQPAPLVPALAPLYRLPAPWQGMDRAVVQLRADTRKKAGGGKPYRLYGEKWTADDFEEFRCAVFHAHWMLDEARASLPSGVAELEEE